MPRQILGNTLVSDVRQLLVKTPTTVLENDSIETLLRAIRHDTQTRHVYVVDEQGKMVGAVRLHTMVEYLFPTAKAIKNDHGLYAGLLEQYDEICAETVGDLCNRHPRFATDDMPLIDVAAIFNDEKITELPVVSVDGFLIGQINMYEVIDAYLEVLK